MAKGRHLIGGSLKIVKKWKKWKNHSMSTTTNVPSFQISCETHIRWKDYKQKTTCPKLRWQKNKTSVSYNYQTIIGFNSCNNYIWFVAKEACVQVAFILGLRFISISNEWRVHLKFYIGDVDNVFLISKITFIVTSLN